MFIISFDLFFLIIFQININLEAYKYFARETEKTEWEWVSQVVRFSLNTAEFPA